MKKILFVLILFISVINVYSQTTNNVVREGNTFSKNITKSNSTPEKTIYSWKDSKGNSYPIYISDSGSCFVIRISSKTGKEYRQYMTSEVSETICKELNRTYKPKTNSDKKL